jgi:hypothetical protein
MKTTPLSNGILEGVCATSGKPTFLGRKTTDHRSGDSRMDADILRLISAMGSTLARQELMIGYAALFSVQGISRRLFGGPVKNSHA